MEVVRLVATVGLTLTSLFSCSSLGSGGAVDPRAAMELSAEDVVEREAAEVGEALMSMPFTAPRPAAASRFDTETLAAAFAEIGYEPPPDSFVLVGRELDEAKTEFEWFSLGDTGVVPSPDRYWPASTVKLMTAVAALEVLNARGLTSSATLTFEDLDGRYHGPASEIVRLAIQVSNNPAYNRTVLIAGMQNINEEIFPRWGLRHTIMQRRYTRPPGVEDLALRHSPAIRFQEGERTGTIPERDAPRLYAACPEAGNCTSLYELLAVMRRITLHEELPAQERFQIADEDVAVLHAALRASYSRMTAGAEAALGPVDVMNKTGTVPGDDALDHGLITDLTTGRRYLLALSTRWHRDRTARMGELSRQALLAVR
jgi:hypothetical protein